MLQGFIIVDASMKIFLIGNIIFNFLLLLLSEICYCSQIEGHIQQMGFSPSSCVDDMLQFRRCLTASFFLNAAMKQPDGSYRSEVTLLLQCE